MNPFFSADNLKKDMQQVSTRQDDVIKSIIVKMFHVIASSSITRFNEAVSCRAEVEDGSVFLWIAPVLFHYPEMKTSEVKLYS